MLDSNRRIEEFVWDHKFEEGEVYVESFPSPEESQPNRVRIIGLDGLYVALQRHQANFYWDWAIVSVDDLTATLKDALDQAERWEPQRGVVLELAGQPCGCPACDNGVQPGHAWCTPSPEFLLRLEEKEWVYRQFSDTWRWYTDFAQPGETEAECLARLEQQLS